MTSTHDEPGTSQPPAPDDGPQFTRSQVHGLDQLRRSTSDRYVAGVAGGLGRHFGIDPTVVRVVLAAMCLFGGSGLILYAAIWLFVPEDGHGQALIHLGSDARRVIVIMALAVAALTLIGASWGGIGLHFAGAVGVAAVIAAVVIGSHRRTETTTAPPGEAPPAPQTFQTDAAPGFGPATEGGAGAPQSAWQPPQQPPQQPPWQPPWQPIQPQPAYVPAPRRTGLVLFWPTLALIAVGLGLLGAYHLHHDVAAGAWAAIPLGIIGVMLVIGAFVGRPGGLIALGVLTIPLLVIGSVLGNSSSWETHPIHYTPTSAASVQDQYRITNGRLYVDLSQVTDPAALAGRTIDVGLNAGEIVVTLPPGLPADVNASLSAAGDVEVGDRDQSGFTPQVTQTLPVIGSTIAPLNLDVHGRVGHILVTQGVK